MKKSTESTKITKKNKASFFLRFTRHLFSSSSSLKEATPAIPESVKKETPAIPEKVNMIVLLMLQKLSSDLKRYVTSFLPLRKSNEAQSALITRSLMFLNKALHQDLNEDYWVDKFRELIAIEGEDNQNQAEAILQRLLEEENYGLMSKLLSIQKPMKDAAGRHFKSISAMGYTFWASDTRMSRMLEKYINILEEKGYETKQVLYAECNHIAEQGIEFTFNGECIENSKHFDWQPLIEAYNAYIAAARLLINANNGNGDRREKDWAPVNKLWLNIGKELSKVPTHVAQEYCSDIPFSPLSNFKATLNSPILKPTVEFYSRMSDKADRTELWFFHGLANLNLGAVFIIIKGRDGPRALPMRSWGALGQSNNAALDLEAIIALSEMRTVNDRKQTLENLKPLAPVTDFSSLTHH